jgi:hypothetical protein
MDYKKIETILGLKPNELAAELLKELEIQAFQALKLDDSEKVTVITKDLSGNEKKQVITIEQAKAGLKNPRMTNLVIWETEMKFEV